MLIETICLGAVSCVPLVKWNWVKRVKKPSQAFSAVVTDPSSQNLGISMNSNPFIPTSNEMEQRFYLRAGDTRVVPLLLKWSLWVHDPVPKCCALLPVCLSSCFSCVRRAPVNDQLENPQLLARVPVILPLIDRLIGPFVKQRDIITSRSEQFWDVQSSEFKTLR